MATIQWKKIAQEKGLSFDNMMMYGWLNNCYITMRLVVDTVHFYVYLPAKEAAGEEQKQAAGNTDVLRLLENTMDKFKFSRRRVHMNGQTAVAEFQSKLQSMYKVSAFMDEVTELLSSSGFASEKVCGHCHLPLEGDGVPVNVNAAAIPMHESCADQFVQTAAWNTDTKKGSVLTGILGSLLGAIIGAIPWAVLYVVGYMASLTGIVIGYVISKAYDMLGGRKGRIKIVIVLFFIILSVALGQFAGTTYQISQQYDEAKAGLKPFEEMIYTKTEALQVFWTEILASPEAIGGLLKDLGVGVFFALLGTFTMLRSIGHDAVSKKPKRLAA